MDKNEFKAFCKEEFYKRNYKKSKNMYYLSGTEGVMSGIMLQKSNYGPVYYVNYYFFIGDYNNVPISSYPTHYEGDVYGRIIVMSKTQTHNGKAFETGAIEYEEYTQETLRPYFDQTFEKFILPPIYKGKKYILDNLKVLYDLDLRKEEVLRKLQS